MSVFTGEWHPFAARFPMLPDEELKELAEDIAANGQLHPILITPEGVGIDGRNRLRACGIAGAEPRFQVYEGNPAALIVSANVRRRQMTPGQVAMAAAIGLAEQGKRANGRWKRGASADIPTGSNIDHNALTWAGVVLDWDFDQGSDLAGNVLLGASPLKDSYRQVMAARKLEREAAEASDAAQRELEASMERMRRERQELESAAPDLAELVRLEKLTLDDACAAWENRQREQALAQQLLVNEWSLATDGLLTALSWAKSYGQPPAELPDSHPTPDQFKEQLLALLDIAKEW